MDAPESRWQLPNDGKAKLLPKARSALVGRHDKVELDRSKTHCDGLGLGNHILECPEILPRCESS